MTAWDDLTEAINRANAAEIAELVAETGLTWLGETGPVYRSGPVRIGAVAVDSTGTHYCDAYLVVESHTNDPEVRDVFNDLAGGAMDLGHEIWQFTLTRGQWTALIAPIGEVCDLFGLDVPQVSTDQWARCWRTPSSLSDEHEVQLIALGCDRAMVPGHRTFGPVLP